MDPSLPVPNHAQLSAQRALKAHPIFSDLELDVLCNALALYEARVRFPDKSAELESLVRSTRDKVQEARLAR